eukprot:2752077-Amphidinium_carterae.1
MGHAGAVGPGDKACSATMHQARQLIAGQQTVQGSCAAAASVAEPAAQQGRPRRSDDLIRNAIADGGQSAQLAIQLGIP